MKFHKHIQTILPGISLVILIALTSTALQYLPFAPFTLHNGSHPIESVLIAIILGIIIGNTITIRPSWVRGLTFSSKKILYTAIVLLGAGLNFIDLRTLSAHTLVVLLASVISIFFMTLIAGKIMRIQQKTTLLIAIGTAICGSAAIAAMAPTIDAKQNDVAISITTINLLGLLAIFLFPLVGHLINSNQSNFGIWSGISIQAVPQVIAASFSFGPLAGKIATIVKLVRVLLLAPFIFAVKGWFTLQHKKTGNHEKSSVKWQQYVPPFILFFGLMVILRSVGLINNFVVFGYHLAILSILSKTASFFMTMALAAIGVQTDIKKFFTGGFKALVLGIFSAISLAIISALGIF